MCLGLNELRINKSEHRNGVIISCAGVVAKTTSDIPRWATVLGSVRHKLEANNAMCVEADKSSKTIIMNIDDYNQQMIAKLSDASVYKKLRANANPLTKARTDLLRTLNLPTEVSRKMVPAAEQCEMPTPRGLVKLHKPGHPLRLITPSFTLPTFNVSKIIHRMLWPFVLRIETRVSAPVTLVREIQALETNDEIFLCSYDVTALYDNVNTDEFCDLLPELLTPDESIWRASVPEFASLSIDQIVSVCRVVFENAFLQFGGGRYKQVKGVPMGSPCSVAVAQLYLDNVIKQALNRTAKRPRLLRVFVDDLLLIFDHRNEFQPFYDLINDVCPNIRFTSEVEINNCLPFLDIMILKVEGRTRLETCVYRKPTHSGRYCHWYSNVPRSYHNSVLNTLRSRAFAYCSTEDHLKDELKLIYDTLAMHHYPKHFLRKLYHPCLGPRQKTNQQKRCVTYLGRQSLAVRRLCELKGIEIAFRGTNTLRQNLFYKLKRRDSSDLRNVVYEVECSCNATYVGQTTRKLDKRIKEHCAMNQHNLTSDNVSGLTDHLRRSGHAIASYKPIDTGRNSFDLRIKEGVRVFMRKPPLNKNDSYSISDCWTNFLS